MPNQLGLLSDPRGEMRATPRNKLMGLLADALQGAQDYAQRPDPTMPGGRANPVLGLLADGLGLNSAAVTANRLSYGEPLTNAGKANVPFLKPETADVAMMAPISPRNALAALGMGMADTGAAKAIFAGIGAKTADKAALAKAEKMTAAGADPKAVWRDTGWFKGGDGKWRFEIDDSGALFNPSGVGAAKRENDLTVGYPGMDLGPAVGNLIEHPSLRDAYGGLTRSTFVGNKNTLLGDGVQGSFADGVLHVNAPAKAADARSTVLHELQHAVQDREGFSGGGSPDGMREIALGMLRRDVGSGEIESTERAMSMLPMYQRNAYERLAGEAEARAVQKRMGLTAKQRRELFPLDSYDVPINALIYR